MSRINGVNIPGRTSPSATPSSPPTAAPAGPSHAHATPQHPDLARRAATPGGSMAPRASLRAGGFQPQTIDRHSLLPPQFQSPAATAHGPRVSAAMVAAALSRLPARVQPVMVASLHMLQGLAQLAQQSQVGIRNPARQAARNDLAAAFGVLQRLAQDLAAGMLGGRTQQAAPAGQSGAPRPAHPFAHPPAATPGTGPQAHAYPQAPARLQAPAAAAIPAQPQATAAATATASPPPPPKAVDVFQGDVPQARAELKASYGSDEKAAAGMHQMATELKLALSQGRTADLEAFQAKYQDKLQLPEDFAGNAAAKVRLAKVLNESMKAP
jgi:hypothetical protein